MKKYRFIFVVLVYKNPGDLEEFFTSVCMQCDNFHVVVVNADSDLASNEAVQSIAEKNGADFIAVENRGYSYGNNKGIEFSVRRFIFDFLIVCNPDILIRAWDDKSLDVNRYLCGPRISTLTGKQQNPCLAASFDMLEWLMYLGYKKNIPGLEYLYFGINRLFREIINLRMKMSGKTVIPVYGVHGSFMIFSGIYLRSGKPPFLDKMFLFNEERYIAWKLRQVGQRPAYVKDIEILHKEDGSMQAANENIRKREKDSFLVYYEETHTKHGSK